MNGVARPLLPAVQVLGPAVLLQGPAVLEVLRALRTQEHALRANGISASPSLLSLQRAFAVAASTIHGQAEPMSQVRHRDATSDAPQQDSTSTAQIDTTEAAQMLGVTQRQVQRLAATLDGRRLSNGHLIFDRLAVQAYALAVRDTRRTAA